MVTFCCWQRTAKVFFFFCLLLKETWICFNHNIVWQLLHRRPVLCLNISTPLTFCAFSKLTPKSSLLENCTPLWPSPPPTPPWDVINDGGPLNIFHIYLIIVNCPVFIHESKLDSFVPGIPPFQRWFNRLLKQVKSSQVNLIYADRPYQPLAGIKRGPDIIVKIKKSKLT